MNSDDQRIDGQPNRGKYDPGWNDPPTFSYNPQATTIKPKLSLNKRVAFPLNTNISGSSNPLPPSQLPPVIPINPTLPTNPTLQNSPCIFSPNNIDNTQSMIISDKITEQQIDVNEIVNILNEIFNDNQELGNKLEDIHKRIQIMKTMWLEGKLPMVVQTSTFKLVKALRDNDTKTADEIHKALMVDHSCVRSWMVAIKQLILHCSVKKDLLQIEQSEKHEE